LSLDVSGTLEGMVNNCSYYYESVGITNMKGIEAFINLDTLNCSCNELSSLDVSYLLDLRYLGCGSNQLTSLDLSNNTSLGLALGNYYLYCYLYIGNIPSLEKVCVWRLPLPPTGFLLCADGSPNFYFSTDCGK
jgi:hypothetical protein